MNYVIPVTEVQSSLEIWFLTPEKSNGIGTLQTLLQKMLKCVCVRY